MRQTQHLFLLALIAVSCNSGSSEPRDDIAKAVSVDTVSMSPIASDSVKPIKETKTELESDDDCIFDEATQNDDFIKDVKEFSNYQWIDSIKTAIIVLQNGDTLKAKRGGCYHFGISGQWFKQKDPHKLDNLDYWFKHTLWLTERLMDESDLAELKKIIADKDYVVQEQDNHLYIMFNNDTYNEWYLSVDKSGYKTIITTGYYFG